MRTDFNKSVDDDFTLPRIASMLVVPVKNTELVVGLYNSTTGSEFTPIQKSLAEIFSLSLPPIIHQVSVSRDMHQLNEEHAKDLALAESSIKLIPQLIRSVFEDRLFDVLSGTVQKCFLFALISETEAIRFPGGDIVEVSDNLLPKDDPMFLTNEFDAEVDVAGDAEVKAVFVISSVNVGSRGVCIFGAGSNSEFIGERYDFLVRIGNVLLFLLPLILAKHTNTNSSRLLQLIRDCGNGSTESLSKLIGSKVNCKFLDPPVADEPDEEVPLLVSVETQRGIEAILTSEDACESTKSGVVAYAQWLSNALGHAVKPAPIVSVADFLITSGICDVFRCSPEKVKIWANNLSGIVKVKTPESLAYVAKMTEAVPWNTWFDQKNRVMILIATFLRGIEPKWNCQIDSESLKRIKNVKADAAAAVTAVFARKFGIADAVPDTEVGELLHLLEGFIVPATIAGETAVVGRVKVVAVHGFQLNDCNRAWVGQGMVLMSPVYEFTHDVKSLAQRLLGTLGENGRKAELFRVERISLPIVICFSQRQDGMMALSNSIRDAIAELRKGMR
jgi:hypothetical protein